MPKDEAVITEDTMKSGSKVDREGQVDIQQEEENGQILSNTKVLQILEWWFNEKVLQKAHQVKVVRWQSLGGQQLVVTVEDKQTLEGEN